MFCIHGGGGVEIQETETNSQISDWFLRGCRILVSNPQPHIFEIEVMVRQLFAYLVQIQLHNDINGFKAY